MVLGIIRDSDDSVIQKSVGLCAVTDVETMTEEMGVTPEALKQLGEFGAALMESLLKDVES